MFGWKEDYAQAARSLTSGDLERLIELNVAMAAREIVRWNRIDKDREERRTMLCKELVRRGVNPHRLLEPLFGVVQSASVQ